MKDVYLQISQDISPVPGGHVIHTEQDLMGETSERFDIVLPDLVTFPAEEVNP